GPARASRQMEPGHPRPGSHRTDRPWTEDALQDGHVLALAGDVGVSRRRGDGGVLRMARLHARGGLAEAGAAYLAARTSRRSGDRRRASFFCDRGLDADGGAGTTDRLRWLQDVHLPALDQGGDEPAALPRDPVG